LDTVYVVSDYGGAAEALHAKGRAALYVLRALGGPWRLAAFLSVLPDGVLDAAYDFVAKRRYRFFGRAEVCLLPPPEHRARFVDLGEAVD
jgi:predicted DCC family thiol-disulfide oxidoreductase YuxK